MKKFLINRKTILIFSFLVLVLDQSTKYLAYTYINPNKPLIIFSNLLQLTLVRNSGAAFSLLTGYGSLLGILSLCVSISLIIWVIKRPYINPLKGLAMAFLLGGALGNGIDRWKTGYVIDFFELIPINFPVFNFADISINIAIFLLLADTILESINRRKSTHTINPKKPITKSKSF